MRYWVTIKAALRRPGISRCNLQLADELDLAFDNWLSVMEAASFDGPEYAPDLTALRCGFPWQKIVDTVDLVVRDAGERVSQPCLKIDTTQFFLFQSS